LVKDGSRRRREICERLLAFDDVADDGLILFGEWIHYPAERFDRAVHRGAYAAIDRCGDVRRARQRICRERLRVRDQQLLLASRVGRRQRRVYDGPEEQERDDAQGHQ
jgi:hypothetical protein